MIVVACNTASSAAYKDLKTFFDGEVHLATVVDPLVDAVANKGYKKVGIIATKATVRSGAYEQKIKELDPKLEVVSLATPLLVPMIEEGYHSNDISQAVISNYLSHESLEDIDVLLLACTHYPLIKKNIEDYFDGRVRVLDSTDVVTDQVAQILSEYDLRSKNEQPKHTFYVSDFTPSFEETTKVFFGSEVKLEHANLWEE